MKTNNIFFILIFIFFISIEVNGQSRKATPDWYWYLSKDVQRIGNKAYFERLSESQLTVKSLGYPYWAISKGVQQVKK